jgi:EAL domain-containing protein (putative c-di-GMP-specific phosphodiesterase class I)
MTSPGFEAGARAAGAVAFSVDQAQDSMTFDGDISTFGLNDPSPGLAGFIERLGPADQAGIRRAMEGDRLDLRMRLIGDDKTVTYMRLRGRRVEGGGFEGLMLPAGNTAIGGHGRIQEEHALAKGVAAGEVLAWYQPIIALDSGRLAGFEALARWERPGMGVISPDDFLGMADDLDLLAHISREVRANAAADLSSWRAASDAGAELFVAANATVSELVSPGFASSLLDVIGAAKLPAGVFKLEIAETEIMRDPERAAEAMGALSSGGIALALDDFGTGYSSLARLEMLPFDVVKIDRYFVRAMAANESAGTVVQSVIQLASHFGMKVVAEGVEDAETAQQLKTMGCDYAQGFRFSGALAPSVAARVVNEGMPGRFNPAV